MLVQEYVFESAPFPSCHAGTLAETGEGRLLAAWFGGTRESANDVEIWYSTRHDGHWSPPQRLETGMGVPCWNPVLHRRHNGELLLFYRVGPSPQTWTTRLSRSPDGGVTWVGGEQLPAGILGPIKNKPFELADGTLVCGSSVESYQAWACWMERTPDGGKSWTKHGPLNLPGHLHGIIQPAVFGTADGKLAILCRSRDIHQMVRSTSEDGGKSWSTPAVIDLPQNNSGLDAVRLRDGRVVVVYNHSTDARTPLNLAVSGDMGRTWKPGPLLEDQPGEYSYPAIIQGSDGTIHVLYTWKRERMRYARLSPEDLPAV